MTGKKVIPNPIGKAVPGLSADLSHIGVVDVSEMDQQDWTNDENTPIPKMGEVLEPFAWKVLVMPMRAKMVSKGGILIPLTRQDVDQYLNYVGRIVALGPLAYRHEKWQRMGLTESQTPKRGDWMVYPVYQYQRIDFKGTKLILLNDDSFLGKVPEGVSPWDFKLER